MAEPTPTANKAGKPGGLPIWLLAAGGGVVLFLLMRGGGGSSASGSGGSVSGELAAEVSDQLTQQREATAATLAEQKAGTLDALAEQQKTFERALSLQKADTDSKLAAATAAAKQAGGDTAPSWVKSLLDAIAKLTPATPAAPSPTTPGTTAPLGPRPSDDAIREWARGLNIPADWGFAFVGRYGILPRDIPELESWRSQIGVLNASGQWCIGGACL